MIPTINTFRFTTTRSCVISPTIFASPYILTQSCNMTKFLTIIASNWGISLTFIGIWTAFLPKIISLLKIFCKSSNELHNTITTGIGLPVSLYLSLLILTVIFSCFSTSETIFSSLRYTETFLKIHLGFIAFSCNESEELPLNASFGQLDFSNSISSSDTVF